MLNINRWSLFNWSLFFIYLLINLQTGILASNGLSQKINDKVVSTPILTNAYVSARDENDKKNNILRGRLGENVTLPCQIFNSNLTEKLYWWYKSSVDGQLIGSWNPNNRKVDIYWSRDGSYKVLENGNLLLNNARRELVERY